MPNWCFTNITINHNSHEKLVELEALIDSFTQKNYTKNDFGLNWLGNIVGNAGLDDMSTGDFKIACRGELTDMSVSDDVDNPQLMIQTSTAWEPMLQMWQALLDKFLPDAELVYEAEESGCEVYMTNDEKLRDTYIIDAFDMEDIDSDWEANEEEVVNLLQKLLDTDETDVKTLMPKLRGSKYGDKISIHKREFVPVKKCA